MKIYDVEKIGLAFDSMNTGDLPDAFVDKRDYDSLDRAYESLKAEYEKWKKEPPLIARAAIVERNIAIKERDEARADYEHADKLFEERCQQLKAERARSAKLVEAAQYALAVLEEDRPSRIKLATALAEYSSDTPVESEAPTFESLYITWTDAMNGSRSPSIKYALKWMYDAMMAADSHTKSGDE